MASMLKLKPVDRAEIVTLVDNLVNQVAPGTDMVKRPGLIQTAGKAIWAEHGFCALIRLFIDGQMHAVMLDTGLSGLAAVENAQALGLDLNQVEAMVLSHGHVDHTGGLRVIADRFDHKVPVYLHEDAFLKRYVLRPRGEREEFPDFTPEMFSGTNIDFKINKDPLLIADDTLMVTGEIPRETDYEEGFPVQVAVRDGELVPDPAVLDDQAVIFTVKDKGPVVITGCGHAGVINTVRRTLDLTGAKRPHTVMGGFHLLWPTPDDVVRQTTEDLKAIGADYIIPTHCTGWESAHRLAQAMPEAFILNTVGSTINLGQTGSIN